MQVVFTQNHGSSRADDIKTVKPGYARYLLRYGVADIATPDLVEAAEKRQEERRIALAAEQEKMREVAQGLSEIVLEFTEKANEEGHLFGSVAEVAIAEQLSEKAKIEITKDQVRLGGHLKEVGEHSVKIQLVDGVAAQVKVVVTAEGGEEA